MWILISETIIFWILMSLIIWYFWWFWLWTNQEIRFEKTVHNLVKTISENTWDNYTYKITKESYFNQKEKQTYFQYKIVVRTESWSKLNKNELNPILVKAFPDSKNTNTNNNTFDNNSLIYYWWPSVINWAWWDITKAENTFSKYKLVVLWNWLEDPNHPDNENTKKIISDLDWKTEFYWYVNLLPLSQDLSSLTTKIVEWKYMWVKWILIDNASFDYWKTYINNDYESYKNFLLTLFNYTKSQNLKIILNWWIPEDLINNLHLTTNDILTIESYNYSNWVKTDTFVNHAKDFLDTVNDLTYKPKILCIATAWNNDQTKVNEIKNDIWEEMELNCQYRTIQDDYWSDSFASVLTPNN